jgi:uncharacterized membrane protein YfcA
VIVATVAAGFGLGLALGLSGVGGGVVLTPLLILWLRLPATVAVGTSVAFSLVTKLAGGVQHLRQGTVDRSTVAWLAAGSLPTALLTSLAVNTWGRGLLSEATTQRLVAGAVLLSAVVMTLRLLGLVRPRRRPPARAALVLLGMILGAVFALTSVGSGSIAVAALVVMTSLAIAPLVGTDVTHAALMAAVTAPVYLAGGRVDVPVLLPLLVGSLPGVLLGSRLAARLPEPVVRGTVLVAVWAIAVRLI